MDNSYELWSLYQSPSKRSTGGGRHSSHPRMDTNSQRNQMSTPSQRGMSQEDELGNLDGSLSKLEVENLRLKLENSELIQVVAQKMSKIRELTALVTNLTTASDFDSSNSQAEQAGSSSKNAKVQRVTPTKRQFSSNSSSGSLRRRLFQESPNAASDNSDENRQFVPLSATPVRARPHTVTATPNQSLESLQQQNLMEPTPPRIRRIPVSDSLTQQQNANREGMGRTGTPRQEERRSETRNRLNETSSSHHRRRSPNPENRERSARHRSSSTSFSRRINSEPVINNPRVDSPRFPRSDRLISEQSISSMRHTPQLRTTPVTSNPTSPAPAEPTIIIRTRTDRASFDLASLSLRNSQDPENQNSNRLQNESEPTEKPLERSTENGPVTSTPKVAKNDGGIKIVTTKRVTADEFFGVQTSSASRMSILHSPARYDIPFPRDFNSCPRKSDSDIRGYKTVLPTAAAILSSADRGEKKQKQKATSSFEVGEKKRVQSLTEDMISVLAAANNSTISDQPTTTAEAIKKNDENGEKSSSSGSKDKMRDRSGSSSSTIHPHSSASLSSQSTEITTDQEFQNSSNGTRRLSAVAPIRRPPSDPQTPGTPNSNFQNRTITRNRRQDRSNEPFVEWLESSARKPPVYTPSRSLQSYFLANRKQTCQRICERSEKRQRTDSLRKNIISMKKKAARDVATGLKTADDVHEILFCDTTKIRTFNEQSYRNFTKRKHQQFTHGTNPQLKQFRKELHRGVNTVLRLEHNLRVRSMGRHNDGLQQPRRNTLTRSRPTEFQSTIQFPNSSQNNHLRINGYSRPLIRS